MAKRNAQNERLTAFEIPRFRRGNSQLLGKVLQDIGLDIVQPGWKLRPFPEEAQLKRKPDPARTMISSTNPMSSKDRLQTSTKDRSNSSSPNNGRNSFTLSTCPVNGQIVHDTFSQMSI